MASSGDLLTVEDPLPQLRHFSFGEVIMRRVAEEYGQALYSLIPGFLILLHHVNSGKT